MQVIIPRSHDVGKVQQEQLQHQNIHNHHTENELRNEYLRKQNSVNKSDHLINENIRDDQKENNKNKSSSKENTSQNENNSNEEIEVISHLGNILDIQI